MHYYETDVFPTSPRTLTFLYTPAFCTLRRRTFLLFDQWVADSGTSACCFNGDIDIDSECLLAVERGMFALKFEKEGKYPINLSTYLPSSLKFT